MNFKELLKEANNRLSEFDPKTLRDKLSLANTGAILDVYNKESCAYYSWISGFVELFKLHQVVELGGAMGVFDICLLNGQYQDFELWSISLPEHGLEFSYIDRDYPNFHPVVGDDLDLSNWPKELDLSKTDLWFFDSLHTPMQLRAELELYKPFFKEGAIILFDDLHLNKDMESVADDLENIFPVKEKLVDYRLHYTGFTIVEVGKKNDQTST